MLKPPTTQWQARTITGLGHSAGPTAWDSVDDDLEATSLRLAMTSVAPVSSYSWPVLCKMMRDRELPTVQRSIGGYATPQGCFPAAVADEQVERFVQRTVTGQW